MWDKLATRSRSNLYFALVFLDRDRRNAFRDVYRFLRAADDVADSPGDPERIVAELAQWRRELAAVYEGQADHPHAVRLAETVRRYRLTRGHFDTILDGLERDVRTPRIADWPALRAYCERIASSLAYLCLEILGRDGAPERRYARDVAIALQIANFLRDVAEDAARDHIYLPADELRAEGVSDADVLTGRMSDGLARVAQRQADRARALIADARRHLPPGTSRALLVPEIWADIYLALLDELELGGFDVFGHQPTLRRRRKLAIALRRALRERTRRPA